MKTINPMRKIFILLCSFGTLIGVLFPFYADFFVDWAPGKRTSFMVGCIIAGFVVGIFGYMIINVILKQIDNSYKKTLLNKLYVTQFNKASQNTDVLLCMKEEFEALVSQFDEMKKNEEKRLKELSITDCLTSLYNHRYFHEYIKKKMSVKNQKLCLLFCDIDKFKLINDTYGHTVGDSILKDVSRLIKNVVKGKDPVFRYGGEEFVIVLENDCLKQAYKIAERARLNIYNSNLLDQYTEGKSVSISIGIASYPDHGLNIEDLMMKADAAMYHAKRSGRNQCKVYSPETCDSTEHKIS